MEQQLQRISTKLSQILRQYQLLQQENERLQKKVQEYALKQGDLETGMANLQEQVLVLKAGIGKMDPADKKELERKINQYIREINKCIAFLGE
jgi:chromosome segregation ATPase